MNQKYIIIGSASAGVIVLIIIALSILLSSSKSPSSSGAPAQIDDLPDPKQPKEIEQSQGLFQPKEGESADDREQREVDHRLALMRPTPSRQNRSHPPSSSTMGRLLDNYRDVYGSESREKIKRGVESTATFDRMTQLDPKTHSYRMVDPQ